MHAALPTRPATLPCRRTLQAARLLGQLVLALILALGMATVHAQAGQPLPLRDQAGEIDAWDAAQVLADPAGTLGVQDVLARTRSFEAAGPLRGNLGRPSGAVWLRVPVHVPAGDAGQWVLEVDYASLDHVDVHVVDGTRVEAQYRLGDHVPLAERPLPARAHTVMLSLPPGQSRLLLVRVQTTGSLLVPMTLHTPAHYAQSEAAQQALQGLFAGAGLCLLLYSLSQWASLRDRMFGWYALTLAGSTAFFAALSGVGPQHVWGRSEWLTQNGPPFFILLGVCGAFFFVLLALEVDTVSPRVARIVRFCGLAAGTTALLFLAGAVDYGMAQTIGMALGPTPLLLVLPTAVKRLRAGDRAARWVLVGWGAYSMGVLVIVSVLRGGLPVNFWTMHGFQFASLLEMAMWMVVLGERVQSIRRAAAVAHGEHDRLRSMAHTDALTGLLNRRGLAEAVAPRLAQCGPGHAMAVYLLDLDGFKPVNDSFGHEAGDVVLVTVARRLQSALRASDLVCRLGGDEFVVVAGPLKGDADQEAALIGNKLLKTFDQPFSVNGCLCRVGGTIGYAIAPHDDRGLDGLLQRADAAMYAGKQGGRHCVKRGGSSAVLSQH